MSNEKWQEPIINSKGIERLEVIPDWIKIGAIIVLKGEMPLMAEIIGFAENGNPHIEFDDTGEDINCQTPWEVSQNYEPYIEGMKIMDRTGKGRITNPEGWPSV